MDKDVVHTHTGLLLCHKRNEIGSFREMWMDLETVIQGNMLHVTCYNMMQEIPPFSHVSLSATKTLSPKIGGFLSVWRFLLFFVCSWKPVVNKMSDFLTPGSCLHFSAFSSYLLSVTSSSTQSHWFLLPDTSLSFPFLGGHPDNIHVGCFTSLWENKIK